MLEMLAAELAELELAIAGLSLGDPKVSALQASVAFVEAAMARISEGDPKRP